MLENLRIPGYEYRPYRRYRDNAVGAENQQERLIQLGWVTGLVDGEGCFSTGFVRQPRQAILRATRPGTLNRKKPRRVLIRILRGHTPEVQDTGS
jgi:hypothetical protein